MKVKIIFGIVIPLIVIITLAILGSVDKISVEENYLTKVSVKEAFGDGVLSKTVKIGEIILTNEHFLAKRSDLPNLGACLVDEDWSSRPLDAGNVVYSEGDFGPDSEFYYDNNNERSIEIGAREEETVRVYIEPSYIFQRQNYSELVEAYGSYDNLVVYEKEKNRGYYYDQCGSLDESVLEEGVKIDLVF